MRHISLSLAKKKVEEKNGNARRQEISIGQRKARRRQPKACLGVQGTAKLLPYKQKHAALQADQSPVFLFYATPP